MIPESWMFKQTASQLAPSGVAFAVEHPSAFRFSHTAAHVAAPSEPASTGPGGLG